MWDDALSLLRSPAIPTWIACLIIATRAYRAWPDIMLRWNERRKEIAAEKAADWVRLRDEVSRLSERVESLETKVEECEKDRLTWMNRAIRAEAMLQGLGEVRQAAASAAAEVRLDDIDKKKREEPPGK